MLEYLCGKFRNSTILVVGDVMIDAYLTGSVSRISPEAPVPIVDIKKRYYRLGGAANVALNLHALGANPLLCSIIGNDEKGELFFDLMKEKELSVAAMNSSETRKTGIKYRVIGNKLQMLRIDEEDLYPLSEKDAETLLKSVKNALDNHSVDAIIFEDYDKGVLSETVIRTIMSWAQANGIPVTVDPKKNNFNFYQGSTLFKPNLKELKEGLHYDEKEFSMDSIHQIMKEFADKNEIQYLFTTLSEKGVAIYDRIHDNFYTQAAYLRKISDVSGAGDTVIAVATLCLIAGLNPQTTAQIANLSGGIVCEFSGVVPIPIEEFKEEIIEKKLLSKNSFLHNNL